MSYIKINLFWSCNVNTKLDSLVIIIIVNYKELTIIYVHTARQFL